MNNLPESREQFLDNQLAEFTDLLLSGADDLETLEALRSPELAKLQKNVLRLKQATVGVKPSAKTVARMHARLRREMMIIGLSEGLNRLFSRLSGLFKKPAMRLALAGSLAVLFMAGIVTTLLPGTENLPGTAGLQAWAPALIVAGVLLLVLLIWLDRRN